MYSTCVFCRSRLGSNKRIENFPVGRRLAFDAAKGRLWVVCHTCERWNLTPLQERWEAIEECERLVRRTPPQIATEHIGLSRLPEGLVLIRIGRPQIREFAGWRYGDQFNRRRNRARVKIVLAGVGLAAIYPLGPVIGASLGVGGIYTLTAAYWASKAFRTTRVVPRLRLGGNDIGLLYRDLKSVALLPETEDKPWGIRIPRRSSRWLPNYFSSVETDVVDVRGDAALQIATRILPLVNLDGGSVPQVQQSADLMEGWGDESLAFARAAQLSSKVKWGDPSSRGTLSNLRLETRLALEMIAHKAMEDRAMNGQADVLEAAWREADEIADISDNMFLSRPVIERLQYLKKMANKN